MGLEVEEGAPLNEGPENETFVLVKAPESSSEQTAILDVDAVAAELYPPGAIVGERFRIVDLLGRGGMGVVYEAVQLSVDRSIALKILAADLPQFPSFVKRFRQEAAIVASLSHPNIVTLIDFGQTESNALFLAMELVQGTLLADRLKSGMPMSWEEALSIMQQILLALEHAHGKGIIHRDLKPSNVMLTDTGDGTSFVKLLDFGVAKIFASPTAESSATGTGVVVGTPVYISPEQIATGKVDPRSDIYSAGILFYELLTGHPPFFGDDIREVLVRQLHEDVPPLSASIAAGTPERLLLALRRATRKRPADRFQTARAMRLALRGEESGLAKNARASAAGVAEQTSPLTREMRGETPTAFETRGVVRTAAWRAMRVPALVGASVFVSLTVLFASMIDREPPRESGRADPPLIASPPRPLTDVRRTELSPRASSSSLRPTAVLPVPSPVRERPSAVQVEKASAEKKGRPDRVASRGPRRRLLTSAAVKSEPARRENEGTARSLSATPSDLVLAELRVSAWCQDSNRACFASFSLDGGEPQTTRVALFRVKSGTYTVRIDKDGYETAFKKVALSGGPVDIVVPLTRSP